MRWRLVPTDEERRLSRPLRRGFTPGHVSLFGCVGRGRRPAGEPKVLDHACNPVSFQGRRRRALNPLSQEDQKLFFAVLRGEHMQRGFYARDIARHTRVEEARRSSRKTPPQWPRWPPAAIVAGTWLDPKGATYPSLQSQRPRLRLHECRRPPPIQSVPSGHVPGSVSLVMHQCLTIELPSFIKNPRQKRSFGG